MCRSILEFDGMRWVGGFVVGGISFGGGLGSEADIRVCRSAAAEGLESYVGYPYLIPTHFSLEQSGLRTRAFWEWRTMVWCLGSSTETVNGEARCNNSIGYPSHRSPL